MQPPTENRPASVFVPFDPAEVDTCVPTRFEKIVRAHGAREAVTTAARTLTYDVLNASANRIAHEALDRRGTTAEPVALLLENDTSMDPSVVGVVPINPHDHLHDLADTRLGTSLRRRTLTRHDWRLAASSSLRAKNWRRLLAGRVDVGKLAWGILGRKLPAARGPGTTLHDARARALAQLDALSHSNVRHLHVFSEGDEGLDYLNVLLGRRLKGLVRDGRLAIRILPATNHTFSLLRSQAELIAIVQEWFGHLARVTAR